MTARPSRKTEPETRHTPHSDSLTPPADLPDASPLDRMRELTRRVVNVPKEEALPGKEKGEKPIE